MSFTSPAGQFIRSYNDKPELGLSVHFPQLFNIEMQIILVSQTKLNLLTGELKIKKYVVQYCRAGIKTAL